MAGCGALHAHLHQHALPGGALVRGTPLRPSRVGAPHRAPPRFHRPRGARARGGRPQGRLAAHRGVHLVAGFGRGLRPGGARGAGGQPQGHWPDDAARGPQRPPPRRHLSHPLRPHARAGAGGDGGRSGCAPAPRGGGPYATEQAAGRPGAAPGDVRAGRRLHARGAARRGAHRGRLRQPHRRGVRVDAVPGPRGQPDAARYPEFRRVVEHDGRCVVADARVARMHRLNIGTITSDAVVQLRYWSGGRLGSVEESYVSRLKPGDTFIFAGKKLEFSRIQDMTAYVRPAKTKVTQTPRWGGSRLPLSSSLAAAVRRTLDTARQGDVSSDELAAAWPVLDAQARLSRIPAADTVLAETCQTRDGHHLFLYPFEGRLVHEGLAALLALRLTRLRKATFTLSVNDYGLELLTPTPFPFEEALHPGLFTRERLEADVLESVNVGELSKRQFRDIARIAGLVLPGLPGARKSSRQVQASASLLHDVFVKYDPDNLLLVQARREVLEQQFEEGRLERTLARLESSPLEFLHVRRPTPLGFPLVVERISASLSSESLLERVERMKERWTREDARSA
ncbi:hypothetical protein ACLEPN_37765 [Myxococcus sp. 1LA]